MIKLFHKIRQQLLSQNRIGRYLLYAVGEIILVVMGILIALSINNLNANRIEQNNITRYYERILTELDQESVRARFYKSELDTLITKSKRALRIIDSKNQDSLKILNGLVGASVTNWTINYSFPIANEFINQNYLSKLKNDSLKLYFKKFSMLLASVETNNNYNSDQYHNLIEPFITKNINYTDIALDYYKKHLIPGGPKTNYSELVENMELWNIITLKLELTNQEYLACDRALRIFELLKSQILAELRNN